MVAKIATGEIEETNAEKKLTLGITIRDDFKNSN
jgi:hypothetical protein